MGTHLDIGLMTARQQACSRRAATCAFLDVHVSDSNRSTCFLCTSVLILQITLIILTRCSEKVKKNGLKYFSLGESNCTGYNENEISTESSSLTGCRQKDQSNCNDSNPLSACYGRPGFHYVYELVSNSNVLIHQNPTSHLVSAKSDHINRPFLVI